MPRVDQGRGLEEGFDGPAVGVGQAHHQRTVVHQQTRNVGYLVGIDRLTGQRGGAAANRLQTQQALLQFLMDCIETVDGIRCWPGRPAAV